MAAQLILTTAYNKDTLKSYKKNSYFSAPLKIGEPRSEDERSAYDFYDGICRHIKGR